MRCENAGATESSEDYLEAILVIRAERGFCRNVDIAERLGVTRPSVTKALAGLSSRSLVRGAGRDVRLTPEGRRLAGATLEKHEFFRRLLCDAGVDGEDGIRGGVPPGALHLRPLLPPPGGPPREPTGQDGDGRIAGRT